MMARRGWWARLTGRDAGSHSALAELAASVRELAAMQRKHAEQLKKIRDTQWEMDARWQGALDRWEKQAGETQLRQTRETAKAIDNAVERLERLQQTSDEQHKTQQKWRVIFSRQVDAMMRTLHLGEMDLPHRFDTVPLQQSLAGAPSWYRGASLAALERLARRKGYRLVACENSGVNAFFLRNDVAPAVPGASAGQAFRPGLDRRQIAETVSEGEVPIVPDAAFPLAEV